MNGRALAPERVPWAELGWLGWPPQTRKNWVLAPRSLNYDEAAHWANGYAAAHGGAAMLLRLSTGDTLVRVVFTPAMRKAAARSQW